MSRVVGCSTLTFVDKHKVLSQLIEDVTDPLTLMSETLDTLKDIDSVDELLAKKMKTKSRKVLHLLDPRSFQVDSKCLKDVLSWPLYSVLMLKV